MSVISSRHSSGQKIGYPPLVVHTGGCPEHVVVPGIHCTHAAVYLASVTVPCSGTGCGPPQPTRATASGTVKAVAAIGYIRRLTSALLITSPMVDSVPPE